MCIRVVSNITLELAIGTKRQCLVGNKRRERGERGGEGISEVSAGTGKWVVGGRERKGLYRKLFELTLCWVGQKIGTALNKHIHGNIKRTTCVYIKVVYITRL